MKLLHSFGYALRGLWYCLALERNFRIHVTAIVTVLIFARLYGLPLAQYPPILLCLALVPSLEAVNTAVERAVTLASPDQARLARIAKDAAAGGVLLGALGAIGVAVCTFSDLSKLFSVIQLFSAPLPLVALAIYILFFWGFVFRFPIKIKTSEENI